MAGVRRVVFCNFDVTLCLQYCFDFVVLFRGYGVVVPEK